MADGKMKCWGSNTTGGNPNLTPADVSGITDAAAISLGENHTCALSTSGVLRCWGDSYDGQVGNGEYGGFVVSPTQVAINAVSISAGGSHTCAQQKTGVLQCWGDNTFLQNGTGSIWTTPANTFSYNSSGATQIVGKARLSTSALTGGTHNFLNAIYEGDDTNAETGSGNLSHTVNRAQPSPTLSANPPDTTLRYGQTFTLNVVLPSDATGTVTLNDFGGITLAPDVPVTPNTSPSASFEVTGGLPVGGHSVTAYYSGDSNYMDTFANVYPFDVVAADTTVGVTGPGSSVVGETVTFSVTVLPSGNGGGTPEGDVDFKIDDVTVETKTLAGGAVSFSRAFQPSTWGLSFVYKGNGNFNTSTASSSLSTTAGATAVTLTASPNSSSKIGQPVTFTASAAIVPPAVTPVDGTMIIKDGDTVLVSEVAATASVTTSALSRAAHNITATFISATAEANGSTANLAHTVDKGDTSVSLNASPATARPGQAVNLIATVAVTAPASAGVTGNVRFQNGSTALGTKPTASGAATHSASTLPIGTHSLTANYVGNTNLNTSTSSAANVTISPKVGAQVRINSKTAGSQQLPAIARLANNTYVVTWVSRAQDGSGYGVYFQRYAANGNPAGQETLVNTFKTGDQTLPAIASTSEGFVVVWQSAGDRSGTGIYGQRYRATGATIGKEFAVNTTTANNQSGPSVAGLAGGGFVVGWTSTNQDGGGLGVYAQCFKTNGTKDGAEFRVNTTTAGNQSAPSMAALTGGGFVAVWQGADAIGAGVLGQRYSATGVKQGTEFRINTTTNGDQSAPAVASLADNAFVVVWQSPDFNTLGIFSQRYKANGAKNGEQVRVNTHDTTDKTQPAVSAFPTGGYVVSWASLGQDGSGQGVYARVYGATGAIVNTEFLANTTTAGHQQQPSVAAFPNGTFFIAWTSANDGSAEGVFGQRFSFSGL